MSRHPFHDVPGPDRYPDPPVLTEQFIRQKARALGLQAQACAREGEPWSSYARALHQEWAVDPIEDPAAEKRPGSRPDHQGGPTHAS